MEKLVSHSGLENQLEKAVKVLKDGGLVAFPTETVYGLGADASNGRAVSLVYKVKRRPINHPLIVHLKDKESIYEWVADFPSYFESLADKFWPGPLTVILPRSNKVLDEVTGGQETVALRVPAHPMAKSLLKSFDGGIVAPSANLFGRVSPTMAEHVSEDFGDSELFIMDGGTCEVGLESTIVDLSNCRPRILRPGQIRKEEIENVLGIQMEEPTKPSKIRVPGSLESHYAPVTPLTTIDNDDLDLFLKQIIGVPVAVMSHYDRPQNSIARVWQSAPDNGHEYGRYLYALLRRLDASGCQLIVVVEPPDKPEWRAVRDRLLKAKMPAVALEAYIDRIQIKNAKINE